MTSDPLYALATWCLAICFGVMLAFLLTKILDFIIVVWQATRDDEVWEADRQRERIRQALGGDE